MTTDREARLLLDAASSGINSPKELANFMAQVSHESNGLTSLDESFRYTKGTSQITDRVRAALRQGPEALEEARLAALNGAPEKLAELMYGNRMGNDQPGDAFKYRGRGYIQLTGKSQYEEAGKALAIDFLHRPELAADPEYAGKIAILYWNRHVHGSPAAEDIKQATHIINGGENGLADRMGRFDKWEKVLTPDVVEKLTKGQLDLAIQQSDPTRHKQVTHTRSIQQLQETLNVLGYAGDDGRPLTTDGYYGRHTREAVTSFQRHQGLTVDGIVGPNTWAALQEATRVASIAPAMAPPAKVEPPVVTFPQIAPASDLDTPAIRTFQQHSNTLQLADHRNQTVSITGTYDEATRSAMMAFQQTQGLPGTGLTDPATRSLIQARAIIAELQQNANIHAIPMRETPLLDVSAQTPITPSTITKSQPSVSAEVTPQHITQPPHGVHHPASAPPAPSEAMTSPAVHRAVASNRDAFAAIQAQLREMQHEVDAMNCQREQERAKEREHDARVGTYDLVPQAAHLPHPAPPVDGIGHNAAAMNQKASGLSGMDAIDPRQANHPLNGLYNELKTRIPDASEKRLLQFTAACHTHHITAENLGRIDLHEQGDYIRFCPSWPPGPVATVDLKEPAPEPQQCMAHIQQHDQQQVQLMAQIQAQVALTNTQGMQGPVLGGPSR